MVPSPVLQWYRALAPFVFVLLHLSPFLSLLETLSLSLTGMLAACVMFLGFNL